MFMERVKLPSGNYCFWTPTSGLKDHNAEDQLVKILTDTFFANPMYIAMHPPPEDRREKLSILIRSRLRRYEEHSFTLMHENNSNSNGKKDITVIGHVCMIPQPSMQGSKPDKANDNLSVNTDSNRSQTWKAIKDMVTFKEVIEKDPDLIDGYWLFSFGGISVDLRSQGIGELMFKQLLIKADMDGRPVIIITPETRVVFSIKKGAFQTIDEREISVKHKNTSFRIWTLKRVSKISDKKGE